MSDSLQIRVIADVAGLQAQMAAGAASVLSAGQQMTTAWQTVTEASLRYGNAQKQVGVLTDRVRRSTSDATRNFEQCFSAMSNGFNRALNGWLRGAQTFTQAMQKAWQSMAMAVVEQIERMGEKWVATHVLMAGVNALFHTQQQAQDAAGQAAQQTIASTTNVAMATSDAAVAAAGTLAYYSSFAPEIAPAMAAAQYGIGMGFAGMAGFALGGVVPKTQVALVHGGERVLTPSQNSAFERMAARGGSFTSNVTNNIHGASSPARTARATSDVTIARVRRLAADWGYR